MRRWRPSSGILLRMISTCCACRCSGWGSGWTAPRTYLQETSNNETSRRFLLSPMALKKTVNIGTTTTAPTTETHTPHNHTDTHTIDPARLVKVGRQHQSLTSCVRGVKVSKQHSGALEVRHREQIRACHRMDFVFANDRPDAAALACGSPKRSLGSAETVLRLWRSAPRHQQGVEGARSELNGRRRPFPAHSLTLRAPAGSNGSSRSGGGAAAQGAPASPSIPPAPPSAGYVYLWPAEGV